MTSWELFQVLKSNEPREKRLGDALCCCRMLSRQQFHSCHPNLLLIEMLRFVLVLDILGYAISQLCQVFLSGPGLVVAGSSYHLVSVQQAV